MAGTWIPDIPDHFKYAVADLAHVTAILRSHVIRDRQRYVQVAPQPEIGTRLGKQFLRLAQALGFLYHRQLSDPEFGLVLRAASDAITKRRKVVIGALTEGKSELADIQRYTRQPKSSVREELEDLMLLGVARLDEELWSMVPEFEDTLIDSGVAEKCTCKVPPKSSN